MKPKIKIQDIDPNHIAELTDQKLLQAILGAGPDVNSGFAYDVAYFLTRGLYTLAKYPPARNPVYIP